VINIPGKKTAILCPKCKRKMKRVYEKMKNKFTGIGNRCRDCNRILIDS